MVAPALNGQSLRPLPTDGDSTATKPWLWPYRWGDSVHPPISARGSRHLITVIYSCRILHFSIAQIHKGSTAVRAMAFESKQLHSLGQVSAQVCVNCVVLFTQETAPTRALPCSTCCKPRVSLMSRGRASSRLCADVSPALLTVSLLTAVCSLSSSQLSGRAH